MGAPFATPPQHQGAKKGKHLLKVKSKYRRKDVAFIDIVKGDKIDMLLSVVSLRAVTFVLRCLLPFPVFICIFLRFSEVLSFLVVKPSFTL